MELKMPTMGTPRATTKTNPPGRGRRRGGTQPDSSSGLAGALFSTTQQRVFALLFGHADQRFFANELIALTGSGSGAIQRELQRLTDSGLVTTTKEAGRKYFQANAASPLFEELRSIVLKTVGATDPLRAALAQLTSQIQLAVVYGSVAKGLETASSDLDLLVVSDSLTLERLYSALASAERKLSRKVSITLYTCAEYQRRLVAKNPFLTKVLASRHIVLIGNVDELAEAG